MSTTETSAGSTLVKDGCWAIPVEQRPKGWERLNLPEPDGLPTATAPEPTTANMQASDDTRYPLPPLEFAAVFLPIFDGIKAGLQARKTLVDLTHYCLKLEIALQEADIRRAAIANLGPETPKESTAKMLE